MSNSVNKFFFIALGVYLLASGHNSYAADKQIKYNMPSAVQTDYMQGLLKLALSYSNKHYTFTTTEETYSRPRLMESVKNGSVTLMWGGTSDQMEQDYLPVRIDAYRGLMSHRILIIRDGDQARFDAIKTIDDLRKIKFGQGRSWQDASIMESAGFNVVKSTKKPGLFYMLDGGRFDAFPRGANEAWSETSAFPKLNLAVEKQLVLVYPLPTYFFVHKNEAEVAKDIENGLEAAIKDGSFDNYFYNSKEVKDVLDRADLPNRRAFYINNPFLPKATPLERKELWLSIDDLRVRATKNNH
ncbi:MAG: diguanylate cyclase [Gammaproteobacteria bacterium]|nr:MAG: diguanylate cyclase [Gammaproteobacteria bacterium]